MNAAEIYEDAIRELESNKITLAEFEQKIEQLKDVRKNVYGSWIVVDDKDWMGRPTGKKLIKCDQCNAEGIINFGMRPYPYCPFCGSGMR